jgi:hypothetical protein
MPKRNQHKCSSGTSKSIGLEVVATTSEAGVVRCKFQYHKLGFVHMMPREKLFQLRPNSIAAVVQRLPTEIQKKWQVPEFIVFQARITPTFGLEQMGSGYPCKDEAQVKEISELIKAKNQAVPHIGLASWRGGFGIVEMTNPEAWYDEMVLFSYNKPQRIGDQISSFSLKHFKRCLGKPPEMIKEEMLPTTNREVAENLLRQRHTELQAEETAKQIKASDAAVNAKEAAALQESQLLVLSKALPETVKLFQSPEIRTPETTYAAYQRDIFALTGKMYEPTTFNQEQFLKTAMSLYNRRRRKKMGIDPLAYELVAGWFYRGYGSMTPEKRAIALKERRFESITPQGIRKLCSRLRLPMQRKPGFH